MNRNLAMDIVRVTEVAAIKSAKFLGRGDKNLADQAAVTAMRRMFDHIDIDGTVVIGEGEMDEAPMLFIGEKVGNPSNLSEQVDIAVDPLEGTRLVACGLDNAISVIAVAPKGRLLHAPDMYMEKMAVGPLAKGKISLEKPLAENIKAVAKALNKNLEDLTVVMLDRDRHEKHIEICRELKVRIKLITDGDVSVAIATCMDDTGIDMMIGSGGAPEGVLAAAAIKCLGGDMQGILIPEDEHQTQRCTEMGIEVNKLLTIDDLVKGDEVHFAATGVTNGDLLKGVVFKDSNQVTTHSIAMRSETNTIRVVEAVHQLDKKHKYIS